MTTMTSQITSLDYGCLRNRLFRSTQIKENIKAPRHWPLCGEFTGTGEFPAQRASNAENVFIWWRHHGYSSTGNGTAISSSITENRELYASYKAISVPGCGVFMLHILTYWYAQHFPRVMHTVSAFIRVLYVGYMAGCILIQTYLTGARIHRPQCHLCNPEEYEQTDDENYRGTMI